MRFKGLRSSFILGLFLLTVNVQGQETQTEKPFPFRSFMLDVSRHFFDANAVKQLIDTLHAHNFNYFHWHLSDDHGWRIQLEKFPELTEKGSNGQFYTKEDIQEVVNYAQIKGIEVIPELDIPGHVSALLVAYPQLALGKKAKVRNKAIITFSTYMPTKDNQALLEGIFAEVADLFPGKYFHLGGDEVVRQGWRNSKEVRAYKKENNVGNYKALHNFILEEMAAFLKTKGKEAIVWGDMVMHAPLSKDIIVMNWRRPKNGVKALKNGNRVIRTLHRFAYLNYVQYPNDKNPIPIIYTRTPYDKVLQYDLYMDTEDLTDEQRKNILGGGGCLWTEFVPTTEKLWYQISPRIGALGQVLNSGCRY